MATQYIDMTPTWEGILPYLLTIMRDGNFVSQKLARKELTRMAKMADAYAANAAKREAV